MLRPGLHVVRRDVRTIQLGLEWPGVAALPDDPVRAAVLAAVDGFRDLTGVLLAVQAQGIAADEAQQAVDTLLDCGVLVDQRDVTAGELDQALWGAWWLLAGPRSSAPAIASARARARVYVDGAGRLAERIRGLLADEQVPLTQSVERATLLVVASDREPSRDRADEAMRRGVPFLNVGIRELVGLVGPFVVPGRTACLRCVDLARWQLDPCWKTVVDAVRASPPSTPCGPPSLLATIAGYATQEVAMWASGARPVTCDNVVEIPHGLGQVETLHYEPHPECGCGWVVPHETMSA